MAIHITGAPCCWGVDDVRNPYLPPWQKVLYEAGQAGYKAIELGPYGYLPLDIEVVSSELRKNGISIVAGTIFDDLLSEENYPQVLKQVDDICGIITKLPELPREPGQRYKTPYLTVMDWGHDERDYAAGHPDKAPRLSEEDWQRMMEHIKGIAKAADKWGVRAVVHPHAGGYIEFADEIDKLMEDIPAEVAGLCLDTGHLCYSGMEPVEWLRKYADRLDYIHFKDINEKVYNEYKMSPTSISGGGNLLTGGELISPASLKGQEEVLPSAKLEQWPYKEVLSEHIRFFEGCGKGSMCPIGTGMLDYPAIYKLLTEELHYEGYITVEQERDPRNSDTSLRDVKASVDYLHGLGFD